MDIHRCRFVPHPPQSINALAFSHPSDPDNTTPTSLRLALGRQNGDVEIWNPHNGQWVQETILRGSVGKTVEQLAWTQDLEVDDDTTAGFTPGPLRLFSTGGSTSVTEWDLSRRSPKRHAEGNFGDIWCFAAQPAVHASDRALHETAIIPSQLLAAGCGDGTIVLFSTEDNDLRYLRPLIAAPVRKSKVLSITWRDRKTVVAGYEDSIIRIIDVPNRFVVRTMTLGKPAEGNQSVVWTVKCLADGTILSGDSSGELKIWDSNNFSLVQRLKTHQADILDIATSAKGTLIFTFGVDRRTVAYDATVTRPGGKKHRWTQLMHRRFHDHDIKCAVSYESKAMSVLISGGMDAAPIVTPLRKWKSENHRALSHLPQHPQISSSPQARLFVSWWQRDLMIYHLPKRNHHGDVISGNMIDSYNHGLLATIQLKGNEYIQSAQISHDGHFLVASTLAGVRLFQLRKATTTGKPCIRSRPIDLPIALRNFGAQLVGLSPNGHWLYAIRPDNTIVLAKVIPADSPQGRPEVLANVVKLNRKIRKYGTNPLGDYNSVISSVCFSSDSRVLAAGDLAGVIDVWVLEGHEDRDEIEDIEKKSEDFSDTSSESDSENEDDDSLVIHGQKWIRNPAESEFPQLDSAILCLTFKPQQPSTVMQSTTGNVGLHATRHNPHPVSHEIPSGQIKLVAITATHSIVEFDVLSGKLSDWSRRNPTSQLPSDFTKIRDPVMGCFWDCSKPSEKGERLWMYGSTWLFMLDLSQDLQPSSGETIGRLGRYNVRESTENGSQKKKRKRTTGTGAGNEMREMDRMGGGRRFVTKYKDGDKDGDTEMIDIDVPLHSPDDDDDEEEEEDGDKLALMRRNAHLLNEQRKDMTQKAVAIPNGDSSTHAGAQHPPGTEDIDNANVSANANSDPDQDNSDNNDDNSDNNDDNNDNKNNKSDKKNNKHNYNNTLTTSLATQPTRVSQWSTFRYRSIFGIVVLSDHHRLHNDNSSSSNQSRFKSQPDRTNTTANDSAAMDMISNAAQPVVEQGKMELGEDVRLDRVEEDGDNASDNTLEVVIVERPMHDVEQIPRFEGGQDWDA